MLTLSELREMIKNEAKLDYDVIEITPKVKVYAEWCNGSGGMSAGPYTKLLGEFDTEKEALIAAPILFEQWSMDNPACDGWKSHGRGWVLE